jgi:uncharacterized protein YlxW (UPF0749 family)
MKFDEGKLLLLFSGILSGVVLTAFLVNTKANPTRFLTLRQYQNTSAQLNELRVEIKGLYKEYGELNNKLYSYENGSNPNKDVIKTLEKELIDLKKFYGNSVVEGPGIKITINDRHKSVYYDEDDLYNSITHNTDLLQTVNDLRGAGAEAISINGERITLNTSITCEGPIIKINNENVVPPFEILAIGDPDGLLYALTLDDSAYSFMNFRMLSLKKERLTNIKIPAGENLR